MITASPGTWQFAVKTNGAVRLWIDDHILVDSSCGPGLYVCLVCVLLFLLLKYELILPPFAPAFFPFDL